MFKRKQDNVKNLPKTTSSICYNIDDNTCTVDIDIKVVENTLFTIKDLMQSLGGKENKDIKNYDIVSLNFEIVKENEIDYF